MLLHISRFSFVLGILFITACRQSPPLVEAQSKEPVSLAEALPDIFVAVQRSTLFEDSKTFVDCELLAPPAIIQASYQRHKDESGFELADFVQQYFRLPQHISRDFQSDSTRSVEEHIEALWPILSRPADSPRLSTLIPLPNPYVVPGGRFREIYYWDSYFTMLGLQMSDTAQHMIRPMVQNFAFEIDTLGFIPNGNRTYYTGRSQPPFFAMMIRLLAEVEGEAVLGEFAPSLEKEYRFWMKGQEQLDEQMSAYKRVVRLPDGTVLNRYWDDVAAPRPESYREDVELAEASDQPAQQVYRDLRAGAESGWDFSSRWLRDGMTLGSIHTTEILPVDLNTLLYQLELTLAEAYQVREEHAKATQYQQAAEKRKQAILAYHWDPNLKTFQDYDFVAQEHTGRLSAAMMFPLAFGIPSEKQAKQVKKVFERELVREGGVLSTPVVTGQQWDAPNGWAPLQWMSIQGLRHYGFNPLAEKLKSRWISLNTRVYQNTGKLVEKYNVIDMSLLAGGGEYALQDGFGWTNGVLLRLIREEQEK